MSDALWLAGLVIANLWATGNLGVSNELNKTEKSAPLGAVVGAQVGDNRTPVTPAPGKCLIGDGAPDAQEILRAMPRVDRGIPFIYETFRDDIEITTEKLVDRIDAPRFYPLIGPAQIHHRHWKCTVTFTETTTVAYPFPMQTQRKCKEVVYLDKDRLVLCGMPLENNAPFTVETSFEPVMRMVDDSLHPGRQMPCLAGRVWVFSKDGRTVEADGPLTIELYDQNPEAKGKPQLLAVWTYNPEILKTLWREDRRGEGYTLMLPCDPAAARLKKIKLEVKYTPKAGRVSNAEAAVLNLLYDEGSSPAGQTEASEPSVPRIPVPFIEPFSYSPKNRLKIDAETLRQIAVEWQNFWNHETPEPPACAPHRVAAPDILVLDVQKLTFKQGNSSSDPAQQIRGEHLVRPDGTVSLGMFGSVKVDGMTTAQVKNVIEHHLATYFVEPRVSVEVTTYNSGKMPAPVRMPAEFNANASKAQVQIGIQIALVNETAIAKLPLSVTGRDNTRLEVLSCNKDLLRALTELRSQGKASILCEPSVCTLSGQPALICSGGELPMLTASGQGKPNISFKQFGTFVNILPVVQSDGRLRLDVGAELSEPNAALDVSDSKGNVLPGFNTASIRIDTLLKSGQTVVFTNDSMRNKNKQYRVVLITAHVMEPAGGPTSTGAMSLTDVVRLSKRGISEDIIVRQMEIAEPNFKLTVDDILYLSEQGVSDNVIRAIQMRLTPKSAPDRSQLFSY